MAWYDNAVFYHIYPLGLCGCPHENHNEQGSHFDKLTEWAEHAGRLGCTAIYIGPLFESGSHGYDTTDYRKVDGRLGSNDDFKKFTAHCHRLGMKVIVDGVFNHTGRDFFAFRDLKEKRENSAYKDWYCKVNFWGNNEYNDGFSYDNWGGYNMLARLNLWNQEVKNYLFDTVRFWVSEFDIDGIRLDAADVLDFGFMKDLRSFCDGLKSDFWLMGEVIHGDYSRWANEGMLHSVTNYELHKGFYSGHNDHNYFEIAHSIKRLNGLVGDKIRLYTFTDNHDVSRIYSKLNNKAHMVPLAILQYTVPGIPSIYYGSEFGIPGDKQRGSDWNLRPDLNLADFDEEAALPSLFRALGRVKKDFPEVTWGRYQELLLTNRQFAFARILDGSAVITAVNNDDQPAHMEIPLPIEADLAKNLLSRPEEAEEDKEAAARERAARMQAAKDGLMEKAGQLIGASGEIRQKADHVKAAAEKIDVNGERLSEQLGASVDSLREQMENFQRVFREFASACGMEISSDSSASALTCESVELKDGRLILDLAANSGMVIWTGKEKG